MKLPVLVALLVPGLAAAQPGSTVQGSSATYDVKYEEAMNNCTNVGMSLTKGKLSIESKSATAVEVRLDSLPLMSGPAPKGGRMRAASKQGPTVIAGLNGQFSLAGRVDGDGVQLVLVAEYFSEKKPLCQQSWNVSGSKRK